MPDITTTPKTALKIFIASSNEVKEERDECVQIINKLNKVYKHLFIEAVLWEYDMPHSSYPGHSNIQDAINESELKDCPVVVFVFYSKIGKYTREEFEYAIANNKRVFVYFKEGFSPVKATIATYSELLDFQESLNETVLYEKYNDLVDFESQLYKNLNLYISQSPTLASPANQIILDLKEQLAQQEKQRKELEQQLATQTANSSLKAQALEEIKKGDYAAAEEHLKQSAKDSIADAASTFYELGNIKKLQLLYKEAYDYFELAVKIDPHNDRYLGSAGQMANTLGYYDASMDYHQKALAINIDLHGEVHPEVATSYNDVGLAYDNKREYDRAIECYEKALAIGRKLYGEEHPAMAIRNNNLGAAYSSKGKYDKAIEYYEKSLAIGKKLYGEDHPDMAARYNNFGSAYLHKNEYDKAIEYYQKSLAIDKKYYDGKHPKIATRYNNLGIVYRKKGEYEKAIEYYQKALTILKKFLPSDHPNIQAVHTNLDIALAAQAAAKK